MCYGIVHDFGKFTHIYPLKRIVSRKALNPTSHISTNLVFLLNMKPECVEFSYVSMTEQLNLKIDFELDIC